MAEGWYVSRLLLSRSSIFGNIVEISQDQFEDEDDCIGIFVNLEDDSYNDLLLVERELEKLISNKKITNREIKILDLLVFNPKKISTIESELNITRGTLYSVYQNTCSKIAFSLGSYFTNEGYIDYFSKKYDLNEDQIFHLRSILEK